MNPREQEAEPCASERRSACLSIVRPAFYYIMGILTMSGVALLMAGFVIHRIGLSELKWKLFRIKSEPSYKQVMVLPKGILSELIARRAVIENAGNPTVQERHNTVLSIKDDDLGYILRPNVEVEAHTLRTTKAHNWEPPVLIIDRKEGARLSSEAESYLQEQSLLSCTYSIDASGFRKTVPAVQSARKILIVGDSVAFGIGVNDHQTIASCLQQRFGNEVQIVNAAVGGYTGRQALQVAEKLSKQNDYACLIYVACQNDLLGFETTWMEEADLLMQKARQLAPRFDGNVLILFQTYMQYTLHHVLLDDGWGRKAIDKTNAVRDLVALRCEEFGFGYVDWKTITDHYQQEVGSTFGPFALYLDHCHFSALGNALASDAIWREMKNSRRMVSQTE